MLFRNFKFKKIIPFLKKKWKPFAMAEYVFMRYCVKNFYIVIYPLLLFIWLGHINVTWVKLHFLEFYHNNNNLVM